MRVLSLVTNINPRREMPSKNGYIKLWRDIKKQSFWKKDLEAKSIFIELIMAAQHTQKPTVYKGKTITLSPGQLIISKPELGEAAGIESESKVHRCLEKFVKLDIITKENVKHKGHFIGQIITLNNWEKWQNIEGSTERSTEGSEVAYLKGLDSGCERSTESPTERHSNNVSNNKDIKESDRQANLSHLKSAFEHIWKKWKTCKLNIGKTDTSPKTKTFDKNFKTIFNHSYFNKNSQEAFKAEINKLSKFMEKAHDIQGFNRFENMQLPKFLNEKQWRD
jgi:hypothetical protein